MMAATAKRTITLTVEGQTFTKSTTRDYTHAVLGRRVTDGTLAVLSWCGSRVNAEKEAAKWRRWQAENPENGVARQYGFKRAENVFIATV